MKTMKIKTREDALLHCFDLWLWLAVTGNDKGDWPGWKFRGGHLERCECLCPVCGYTKRDWSKPKVYSCENSCLIKWNGRWCESITAEYSRWSRSKTKKDRKKWALEIAILALEAL